MGEADGYLPFPKGFSTKAIHAGNEPEQWNALYVVPPIVTSTTFKQCNSNQSKKFEYGRSGNPTRSVLEHCIASLEEGEYGLTFSSGLGATTAVLSLLRVGDEVICGNDLYFGTVGLFNSIVDRNGIIIKYVDTTNIINLRNSITSKTRMVWIETPSNPLLKVTDIKAAAQITKQQNIILVIDNTFLTPYFQKPLQLGADISLYSLTKYMNGHSDVIMGAIVVNNCNLHDKLQFFQTEMGIVPSPFDCYQVNRGLKTLAIRMKQHYINGLAVAKYLEQHQKVIKVLHPGLSSHPQHEIFKKQASGHSGMVSIFLKGGLEEAQTFVKNLNVFTAATSLGGVESLVEIRTAVSHNSIPADKKSDRTFTDNIIRLSVGLEDIDDLLTDLEQALTFISP